MRAAILCIMAGILLVVPGCGSNDDEATQSNGNLVELLTPGDLNLVTYADFDRIRDVADLPADADPTTGFPGGTPEELRFFFDAAAALPYAATPRQTPIADALDEGQISGAAANGFGGPGAVALVRTDQAFEEIADALEGAGYTREEDSLQTNRPSFEVVFSVIAKGEDGLVAMGTDAQSVQAVLAGEPVAQDDRDELLAELDDAPAGAVLVLEDPAGGCLRGIAIGDQVTDGAGTIVVAIDGDPDPASFILDDAAGVEGFSPAASFEFESPETSGSLLRVPFTFALEEPLGPLGLLSADAPTTTFYTCGGAGTGD